MQVDGYDDDPESSVFAIIKNGSRLLSTEGGFSVGEAGLANVLLGGETGNTAVIPTNTGDEFSLGLLMIDERVNYNPSPGFSGSLQLEVMEGSVLGTFYGGFGATGASGPQGATGPQGSTGATGLQGSTGPQGASGPQGATGIQGSTGPKGTSSTGSGIGLVGFARVVDRKNPTTDGGNFQSGAWRVRDLNTELVDTDDFISVSAATSEFTLDPGKYRIKFSAPAYRVESHIAVLYDVGAGYTVAQGSASYSDFDNGGMTYSVGVAYTNVVGLGTYQILHRCQTTKSDGYGNMDDIGQSDNIFTDVVIEKYATSHAIPTVIGSLIWS